MSHEEVLEFHNAFKVEVRTTPNIDVPEKSFRYKLIAEEIKELGVALDTDNRVEVADAFGDITVVTYGAALTFGVDITLLVETGRELAKDLDLFSRESNALFSEEGRNTILGLLSDALESGDVRLVQSTLATIIITVECAALVEEIPLGAVVSAIHKSNMSKLGEDGEPIFIDYGNGDTKIGKGPNYKKPTEDIKKILGMSDVEA